MDSTDNLVALETWAPRFSGFSDSWFSDVFSRETETVARALQRSMSDTPAAAALGCFFPADKGLPVYKPVQVPVGTPSVSVSGGSENETAGSKRRNVGMGLVNGKAKKRKSRASKSATTTYITADAAHFRQMVQQVTGFKFGGAVQMPVLKPEPHRAGERLQPAGCLPTLDTSAYLLDQQAAAADPTSQAMAGASFGAPPSHKTEGNASGSDFDYFSCIPILESWKTVV